MIFKKGQRVLTYLGVVGIVLDMGTPHNWYEIELKLGKKRKTSTWMVYDHIIPIKGNLSKNKLKALHKLVFR